MLGNQQRAGQGGNGLCFAVTDHSPAGVSEYEVQAAHLQLPPTLHCQLHYVAAAAVHSALHRALQARAASDGEYESAAAQVPVQKYKLQAATNTFQIHF